MERSIPRFQCLMWRTSMPQKIDGQPCVAVIGGGYAGIRAARDLDDIANVVLVEPRDSFRHNVGALRAMVRPDWMPNIFMSYEKLLANGKVVHDRAAQVQPGRVELASGQVLDADFIVLATGSQYPFPAKDDETSSELSKKKYLRINENLESAKHVLLLGAGVVGVELVGEILARWPEKQITLLDPSADVLKGQYPEPLRAALREMLSSEGVDLRLGEGLRDLPQAVAGEVTPFVAETTSGARIDADLWLQCFGGGVTSDYVVGSLAQARTESGRLRVHDDLRVQGHDTVYAVGDIADLGLPTAFIADVQADIAARNIRVQITGEGESAEFQDPFPHLVVPFGTDKGTGWMVNQDELLDTATVKQLKGDHLLIAMYTDRLGLTDGAWTIGH
ncbi:NAD(P)/FAD-dependent oxidoreductase [Streptomyces cadmiisoli]|uniref:FAD-dependent oxidoreductase n=1 Tax=Streptomyces cadmiisoli TaxID=2184053 RepID=A0A2Z4ITJ8_9ACTN|nr:FAD-dependent oxidoreductase [Streptomyces cadmiisoli]